MILQPKADILSRKKYFIMRRGFFLRDVINVTLEKNGIQVRMKGLSNIVIMNNLRGNELIDVTKAQI
jgi:hypothetical protein